MEGRAVVGSRDRWILLTEDTEGRSRPLLMSVRWDGSRTQCENSFLTVTGQCSPAFTCLISASQEKLKTILRCADSPRLTQKPGSSRARDVWEWTLKAALHFM